MRIGIVLHEHQADDRRMRAIGEVIGRVGLDHSVPITFSFSGMTIDALARCCPDVVQGMRWEFANKPTSWNPYRPEAVISTQHNNPLMLPFLETELWGTYLQEFASTQIAWSKGASEGILHRTPLGFFPSEMIFAPAAAYVLAAQGLEYCLIAGEPLRAHEKGHAYHVPHGPERDVTLLPRVNEFTIGQPLYADAYYLKDRLKEYGRQHGLAHLIVGCDLGEFTGLYHLEGRGGISLQDGIARLIHLGRAIHDDPDVTLMNCGGIARSYAHPHSIYDLYASHGFSDPHHHLTTWMNGAGDLGSILADPTRARAAFVAQYATDPDPTARDAFFHASGMEQMMEW